MFTVIWADDIAWATETTTMLVPAIVKLVQHIEQQFSARGFSINYELNKTHVVISFQGPQAPDHRRKYLLVDRPGVDCTLEQATFSAWLHLSTFPVA